MSKNTVTVQNSTRSPLYLPPVPGYDAPKGICLIPGINHVPKAYLDLWLTHEVPVHTAQGAPRVTTETRKINGVETRVDVPMTIRPGKKAWDILTTRPVRIGDAMLPQIQVLEGATGKELEGPPSPFDLRGMKEPVALRAVEGTLDLEALARWADGDDRPSVRAAAQARLSLLRGK